MQWQIKKQLFLQPQVCLSYIWFFSNLQTRVASLVKVFSLATVYYQHCGVYILYKLYRLCWKCYYSNLFKSFLSIFFHWKAGNPSPLEEIQKKTGAHVQMDPDPSPVQGTKIVVIRGSRSQIEDTVRLINRTTGAQVGRADTEEVNQPLIHFIFFFMYFINRPPIHSSDCCRK